MELGYVIHTTRNSRITIQVRNQTIFTFWQIRMMADIVDLQNEHCIFFRQSKSIAITSMAFPKNEINNFVLGSEDGNVYSGEFRRTY